MRRSIFVAVAALSLLASQAKAAMPLGVEGGVNFTKPSSSPIASDSQTKFIGGILTETDLAPGIHLQPELLYKALSPDFLALPLMLKFKFDVPSVRPFIMAGPEPSLRVGSSTTVKSFDLALDFGAGLECPITPQLNFLFNARYALGLLELSNVTGISLKQRGIYLMAGLGFSL